MKRAALRVTIQVASIAILVALTLVVIGPIRTELERRITGLKVEAIGRIENILGRRISYSSISPSILRFLAVNDLTVHGLAGEPADLVTIQTLRIYYRPIELIRGRLAEAFSEVRIENTTLSVDTRRDADLVAIWSDIAGSREARGATNLLPENLTLSGRNIELSVATDIGIFRVDDLIFASDAADDVVSLRGEGDIDVLLTSVDLPVSEFEGRVMTSGTIDLNTGNALFDLTVPRLRSDIASMERQVFQVSYDTNVIEARKVRDRNPVDVYLRLKPEPMEIYARILSDGYRLSDLVQLQGEYEQYNQYLEAAVRGQASATITEAGITYAGSILTRATGLPVPDGDLSATFSGDSDRITFEQLDYRTDSGDVEFQGDVQFQPLRPSGRFGLRNLVAGDITPLSVTGTIASRGDTVSVNTNRFTYAGVRIEDLSGLVTFSEYPFSRATLLLEGNRSIALETEHEPSGAVRRFTVDARSVIRDQLERLQLAVARDLQLPDLDFLPDSLVVDTRMAGELLDGLSLQVPYFHARDSDRPGNSVSLSLLYSGSALEVSDVAVSFEGYEGSGEFVADLDNGGLFEFDSSVVVEGIPYEFTGIYDPEGSLRISGLHDVDAVLTFGEREELIVSASGNVPIPIVEGLDSRLVFSGEGYFASETDWTARFSELKTIGLPYLSVEQSDIRIVGEFGPTGGTFEEFGYSDRYSDLVGKGSIEWQLPDLTGGVDLVLTDALGEETYAGSVSYDGENLELLAAFTELPLLRAGISTIRGSLSGEIDLWGPPGGLSTRVQARLNDGRFNGDLVEFSGLVTADPQQVVLEALTGRYVRTRFENVSGTLQLSEGTAKLAGNVVQPGEAGDVTVGLDITGEFADGYQEFAELLAADFVARALVTGLPVRNDLPEDWQFRLNRTAGDISLIGGPQDALVGYLEQDGDFTVSLSDPVPLSFEAVGTLREGVIEADLTNVRADVARLWRIVESPGVTFVSGTAEGSVRIVGPLNDPDYYGTLVASNITGAVDIVSDLIGPARAFLVLDEKTLTVRETVAPTGTGRTRLSAAVTLDRWLPEEYRVWVDTVDSDSIRVVNDFGGVAIDGLAQGSLVVTGGAENVRIEGDLVGSSMNITLSDVQESEDDVPDSGDLIVDVNLTTGRGVQFLWPTDTFPILRGFADAGETARITHRQSTGSFTVEGAVNILGGEMFYFDRSFYIKEGRMVFAEDENEFDPLLTVEAEIREVGPDGPLRIYLVADERPLSEFTPQWRSDPPIPEAEIVALLGGNVFITDSGEPINLSDAVLLTSDLVSQFGIIRGFENTIRETLALDLFSIRTQLFQNLIRGVLTESAYPLDSDVPSLGKYFDNTTLFLGKYLGTDLFLELLVQLRATDPDLAPTRSLAGIAVDSELSLEWETPFFTLEWSFFPRTPSSLFLTDNTISFGWEYSY